MNELKQQGFIHFYPTLPPSWKNLVQSKEYNLLDQEVQQALKPTGFLYQFLNSHLPTYFQKSKHGFEHILALRVGPQDPEEDGIWHDDGTRLLAFSMSLNTHYHTIEGGHLSLRKKNTNTLFTISPRPYGQLTAFSTGMDGWEHKTNLVIKGERLIIAGWLT